MRGERVRVESHAGHRGEERPLALHLRGERIEVTGIVRAWVEQDRRDRAVRRCFKVQCSDGRVHTVCYDEGLGAWFLGP
jgi:hypothetical protein